MSKNNKVIASWRRRHAAARFSNPGKSLGSALNVGFGRPPLPRAGAAVRGQVFCLPEPTGHRHIKRVKVLSFLLHPHANSVSPRCTAGLSTSIN